MTHAHGRRFGGDARPHPRSHRGGSAARPRPRREAEELHTLLGAIDGRGYKAYEEIEGSYDLRACVLFVDHVQRDPFASPSRLRVHVSRDASGLPRDLATNKVRRIAAQDYLARAFRRAIARHARGAGRGSGQSGRIAIDAGGQEVLERSAVGINDERVEARFTVGLPAVGRRVLGREAAAMLLQELPRIVDDALLARALDAEALRHHLDVVEDQDVLRRALDERGLVAFAADGSVLPRRSGIDDRPLATAEVVPLCAPLELRVTLTAPHRGEVTGLGIPRGVTLIVGGGFHGKSTLLTAIERGVYDHVPGDGREYVVTDERAVKIRAEDGRRIAQTDISPFIRNLPFGKETVRFSTDNASGSTSQVAGIMEALEVGARVLLMDEDTSATNFMIRDARMQMLVAREHEPITPFVDKVRQLADEHHVATTLVMGGSGDYFDVADTVIMMKAYRPLDVTRRCREIAGSCARLRQFEGGDAFGALPARRPLAASFDARRGKRDVKISTRDRRAILYGTTLLDLAALEQLVDGSQTRAIGLALHYFARHLAEDAASLRAALQELDRRLECEGLDVLSPHPLLGDLARPRIDEIAAAINRLRSLRVAAE